jgi:hypothetical protein
VERSDPATKPEILATITERPVVSKRSTSKNNRDKRTIFLLGSEWNLKKTHKMIKKLAPNNLSIHLIIIYLIKLG